MSTQLSNSKEPSLVDYTQLYLDFCNRYRNVFIVQIMDETYIYRAIGRAEYRDILDDPQFSSLQKEEMICSQCLLYPDPENYSWDDLPAGIPSELAKEIIKQSFLDSIERRRNLTEFYRAEMLDLDNQITCIISEAFPGLDIEDIERWDVEKTTKYLSRAEWVLHQLRGLPTVEARGEFGNIQNNEQPISTPPPTPKKEETIRGGNKNDKLTPEKMKEYQEFVKKFPEFAGLQDDAMVNGIDGLAQAGVDKSPALRVKGE
jgi:hypothetical protein